MVFRVFKGLFDNVRSLFISSVLSGVFMFHFTWAGDVSFKEYHAH